MFICLFNLRNSVWFDESFSAYLTHFDFGKIWELTAADVHPPLFYFLLKIWAHIFGHTDFAMRFMSVFFGAVAIMFAYMWLKYKYGARAAVISALLLTLSPTLIRYGQEMRMYTMVFAIVTAGTYFLQLAIDNGQKKWWVIYAILLALGMWTHYFTAFAWMAHLVYLFIIYGKKIWQKQIILTYVLAIVLFLPWIPGLIHQTVTVQTAGFWIPEASVNSVADFWTESLVYEEATSAANWLLPLVIITTSIIAMFIARYYKQMRMLLCMLVVPLVCLILLSMPPLNSMFIPRYVIYSSAALTAISGVGMTIYVNDLAAKKERRKNKSKLSWYRQPAIMGAICVIVLITTGIVGVSSVYAKRNYSFENHNINTANELFETIVAVDGGQKLPIVVDSVWLYYDLSFYETDDYNVFFISEQTDYEFGSLTPLRQSYFGRIDDLDDFLSKNAELWYVGFLPEEGDLEFPNDDYEVAESMTLNFNKDGGTYQVFHLKHN